MYLLEVVIFLVLFGFPLYPGLHEIFKPRDNTSLQLNPDYARDPHFFGDSMRSKIAPLMARKDAPLPYKIPFLGRRDELALIDTKIIIPPRAKSDEVLIARDRIDAQTGASLLDAYGMQSVETQDDVSARTILSDGDVRLGKGCKVGRWIDAAGTLSTGPSCNLGSSATAGGRVRLGPATRFTRVFGLPILGEGAAFAPPSHGEAQIGDLIERGDVRIDEGKAISGSVKAHGSLTIGAGASVHGNLIARGNITLEPGAHIDGHIFCEGRLTIGPGVSIGTAGSRHTAYGEQGIRLSPKAQIYGWLVSDSRESVVA